jgi:hypothetical protein
MNFIVAETIIAMRLLAMVVKDYPVMNYIANTPLANNSKKNMAENGMERYIDFANQPKDATPIAMLRDGRQKPMGVCLMLWLSVPARLGASRHPAGGRNDRPC